VGRWPALPRAARFTFERDHHIQEHKRFAKRANSRTADGIPRCISLVQYKTKKSSHKPPQTDNKPNSSE